MSTTQQLSPQKGGRPQIAGRRSLYVRVAPSIWEAFAAEAAGADVKQVELMRNILSDRYRNDAELGPLERWPGYQGESRRYRVALEVKVPADLWELFNDEATTRNLKLSDHMEDLLAERYRLRQGKTREVVPRKSA